MFETSEVVSENTYNTKPLLNNQIEFIITSNNLDKNENNTDVDNPTQSTTDIWTPFIDSKELKIETSETRNNTTNTTNSIPKNKDIPMQNTTSPLALLIFALLNVLGITLARIKK